MPEPVCILFVEDDSDEAFIVQKAIVRASITTPVELAISGDHALRYLQGDGKYADRNKYPFPSLILTDLNLPKFSGIDLIQWLKFHHKFKIIPVMVLSNSSLPEHIEAAYAAGVTGYFVKPKKADDYPPLLRAIFDFVRFSVRPPNIPSFS